MASNTHSQQVGAHLASPGQMTAAFNTADPGACGVMDIGLPCPQPKAGLCRSLGRWAQTAETSPAQRSLVRPGQARPVLEALWRRQGEGTNSIRERGMASDSTSPFLGPGSS